MADPELLTTGKIAEKLGVSQGKVTRVVKEKCLELDAKKGACGYYSPEKVKLIAEVLRS